MSEATQKMSLEEWKQMRDQQRSEVMNLLDKATTDLVETPGAFTSYLDTQARMDKYTVGNALLITAQLPEASKLKSFDEWTNDGATVKKGSKSISIIEPAQFTKKDGSTAISFNIKKVFDISQTSKAEEVKQHLPIEIKKLIAAMIDTCPCSVDLANEIPVQGTAAYYDKAHDTLYVQKEGGSADYVCQCVARELGQREAAQNDPDYSRNTAFADAAITGYLVCRKYGVPTDVLDVSRAASKYNGMTSKDIRSDLKKICSYANEIKNRINDEIYKTKQPRSRGNER